MWIHKMTQKFFKPRDLPDPLKWKENPTQIHFLRLSPKSKYSTVHSELPSIQWCSFQLIQPPAGTAAEERPVYIKNKTINWAIKTSLPMSFLLPLISTEVWFIQALLLLGITQWMSKGQSIYVVWNFTHFFFSPLHHSCEKTGTTQDRMISFHNTVM